MDVVKQAFVDCWERIRRGRVRREINSPIDTVCLPISAFGRRTCRRAPQCRGAELAFGTRAAGAGLFTGPCRSYVIADRVTRLQRRLPDRGPADRQSPVGGQVSPALCRRRREPYTRNPERRWGREGAGGRRGRGRGVGKGAAVATHATRRTRVSPWTTRVRDRAPETRVTGGRNPGVLYGRPALSPPTTMASPPPPRCATVAVAVAVAARAFRVKPDSRRRESVVPRRHGILKVPRLKWLCPRRFSVLVGVAEQWLLARSRALAHERSRATNGDVSKIPDGRP
jgi:hypothetical protein